MALLAAVISREPALETLKEAWSIDVSSQHGAGPPNDVVEGGSYFCAPMGFRCVVRQS
jgi:hypothetical protein